MWGGPSACCGLPGRSSCENLHVPAPIRRLPHLYVLGQPLFVTFRLYDSLPPHRAFPSSHLTSGKAFAILDRLLDQARCGPTFLRQPAVAQEVFASLEYGAGRGDYELHAWVIMPNHVHLLFTPHVSVSRLLGSLKSASAKRANLLLKRTGRPFWQEESYDHWFEAVKNSDGSGVISKTIPLRLVL